VDERDIAKDREMLELTLEVCYECLRGWLEAKAKEGEGK
jgi:hypothetical protein